MAIPYDYYRIFYYVAQHKSFTKAAEALGNNQPNITRCMNNLEQDLGCKLFVRTNHGVSLTPEGQRLYSRAAVAFEQLRLGESELRSDCSLRTGSISIAASEAALHLTLLDRLDAFHRRNPGIHLRITNDSTPRAMEGLLRGQVDCAAVTTPCPVRKPLRETALVSFREILICGSDFHDLTAETRSLRDLENLFNVFIYADTKSRSERAVQEYHVDERRVEAMLRKIDKRRETFYSINTGGNWYDKDNYHLCLNSGALGLELCADIVVETAKKTIY